MTQLHYLDPNPSGKPIVLLLHGLGADGASWTLQFPALVEAGYRPIAPDASGFGGTVYDGQGWSIKREAEQLAGFIKELGNNPVHVVGLSMGGLIAQQLTLDFPALVEKLVLVSTFAVLRPEKLSGWWYFVRRVTAVMTLGTEAQAKVVAQRLFPQAKDETLRKMYMHSVAQADARAYRKAMLALGLFDSRKRLVKIRAQTLVITGMDDTTVSPARQKKLCTGISNARQVCIAEAGHAVSVDQAGKFNQELLAFLNPPG